MCLDQFNLPNVRRQFDAEGKDYDYTTAMNRGLRPTIDPEDGKPHWPSRDPNTGMLLKGASHPTFQKGVEADAALGYRLIQRNGRYFTVKE